MKWFSEGKWQDARIAEMSNEEEIILVDKPDVKGNSALVCVAMCSGGTLSEPLMWYLSSL